MIAWLVYSLIVGAFLAVAALAAESLLKSARRPVRAVWVVAITLTVALTLSAPLRSEAPAAIDLTQYMAVEQASEPVLRQPTLAEQVSAVGSSVMRSVLMPLNRATDLASTAPASLNRSATMLAIGAAVVALLVLMTVYARSMRERIKWPLMLLLGKNVRVTPNVGPAVLGLAPPEIVVPRWVLLRNTEEQRLVLEHESEHVRANDPLLLMFACLAVACMPWNAALWFMWSRLRLAVELDCDRRVLKRGVQKPAYGQLLVELSSSRPWTSPAIPAFSWGTSHLEQRLVAMTARPQRFRLVRRVASGAVIATALLAASKAEMPAPEELQAMDASHLSQSLYQTTRYFYEGKEVTKDSAYAAMLAHPMNATFRKAKDGALAEMHLEAANAKANRKTASQLGIDSPAVNPLWSLPKGDHKIYNLQANASGSVRYTSRSKPGSKESAVDSLTADAINELTGTASKLEKSAAKPIMQDTIPRKKVAPPKVVVKKPVARRKVNRDTVPLVIYNKGVARKVRPGEVIDTIEFAKRVRLAADSLLAIELIRSGRIATEREPVRYIYGKNLVVKDSATGMIIVADSLELRGDSIVTLKAADSRVRIRGQSALTLNSGPMIIVDGVIVSGDLADIDPKSIQHVEVIKGAAAAALYGTRAANGIIRITTKR